MQQKMKVSLLFVAALTTACTIPPGTLSNNITSPFAVQVKNASYPVVHNRLMNGEEAGGGDKHLYLSPDGDPLANLTLVNGIITQDPTPIRAVINGQYTPQDNTTKIFMTERGDPRAIFQPIYSCSPDDGSLQTELLFQTRQDDVPGGGICVRLASGGRYEFRWSPPNNTVSDGTGGFGGPCILVRMFVTQ